MLARAKAALNAVLAEARAMVSAAQSASDLAQKAVSAVPGAAARRRQAGAGRDEPALGERPRGRRPRRGGGGHSDWPTPTRAPSPPTAPPSSTRFSRPRATIEAAADALAGPRGNPNEAAQLLRDGAKALQKQISKTPMLRENALLASLGLTRSTLTGYKVGVAVIDSGITPSRQRAGLQGLRLHARHGRPPAGGRLRPRHPRRRPDSPAPAPTRSTAPIAASRPACASSTSRCSTAPARATRATSCWPSSSPSP